MKKSIKSALSLFVAVLMILAMMPSAMAAVDTSKLPTGNSTGRLIEASMSIRVGNNITMDADDSATYTDGAVLADGFHFAAAEILNYTTVADISSDASGSVTLNTPDGKTATTGTRTLDSTNNTIEFEWEAEKSVKRLEMWVWPVGAIKDYEIQYFNGTSWVTCSTGTLDQTQPAPELDAANYEGKRAVSYIMTFDEVKTTKLRFIAKSFKTGYTSAKIGEAIPRSDNNVNLLQTYAMTRNDTSNGWLDAKQGNANAGYNSRASQYALNFGCSKVDTRTDHTYSYNYGAFTCASPVQKNYPYSPCAVSYDATAGLWYAVRLTDSPQKVNKVTFNVKTGTIRKFEIWCNTATSATINQKQPAPSGGNWQLMTTVTGNFASGTVEAYIPNTVAAEYWMIKVTDCDTSAQFSSPGLYVLANSELPPSLTDAKLTGSVEEGGKVTFSAYSFNNNVPNAKVYFALYSDGIIENVAVKPLALSANDNRTYSVDYTIPSDATGTLSVRAFYLDSTTLVPLIDNPPTVAEG